MTSRNGLPSPREPPRPNIARARSFMSRMCSWPSTAMTPSTIASSIAVILRLLLLEVLDLLAQPPRHHVERAAERADLVGGARGRADQEAALAHLAGDGLHLDHRPRHPARHEDADPERDEQGHRAARQHHLVERRVGGGHRGERQGEPQRPEHAGLLPHRHRDVQERRLGGGAPAQGAPGPARERRRGPRAAPRGSRGAATSATARSDSATTRPSGAMRVTRAPVARATADGQILSRRGGRASAQERPRLVVDDGRHRAEPRLQRLHREILERPGQVDARDQAGDRHEADQGQRQLERDAAADDRGAGRASGVAFQPVAHARSRCRCAAPRRRASAAAGARARPRCATRSPRPRYSPTRDPAGTRATGPAPAPPPGPAAGRTRGG